VGALVVAGGEAFGSSATLVADAAIIMLATTTAVVRFAARRTPTSKEYTFQAHAQEKCA
jgi:hypothetical protein